MLTTPCHVYSACFPDICDIEQRPQSLSYQFPKRKTLHSTNSCFFKLLGVFHLRISTIIWLFTPNLLAHIWVASVSSSFILLTSHLFSFETPSCCRSSFYIPMQSRVIDPFLYCHSQSTELTIPYQLQFQIEEWGTSRVYPKTIDFKVQRPF